MSLDSCAVPGPSCSAIDSWHTDHPGRLGAVPTVSQNWLGAVPDARLTQRRDRSTTLGDLVAPMNGGGAG